MPGLQDWNPKGQHMTQGLKPGQFLSGKQCFVGAGPPMLSMFAGNGIDDDADTGFAPPGDVVYPIALLQTWALAQNKALSRLFEIGSDMVYFATGHSVGQLSLSNIIYHGPNLLRMLYAWMRATDQTQSPFTFPSLLDHTELDLQEIFPYTEGDGPSPGIPANTNALPIVEIEPGYENHWFNLASDAFDLPFGMLFLLRDSQGNNISSFYLEQCHVPNHQLAVDAQGIIMQESATVHYGRMVPIPVNAIALLNGLIAPDQAAA